MEGPASISMSALKTLAYATEESVPTSRDHIHVYAPEDLFRDQILRHALISTSATRIPTFAETVNATIQLDRFSADAKRDTQLNLEKITSAQMMMSVFWDLTCVT